MSCVDDFCGTVHFPKQRAVVVQEGEETSVSSELQSLAVLLDSKTQIPTRFAWDGDY